MTMTFSLHESIEPNSAFEYMEVFIRDRQSSSTVTEDKSHFFADKLTVPVFASHVDRPRVMGLIRKSRDQFPATLITGRAGTGKTSLAANLAAECAKVCWYTVGSTDVEWGAFARYFSASLLGSNSDDIYRPQTCNGTQVSQNEIARFLIRNFTQTSVFPIGKPALIVLDDVHHIFDAPWFDQFFNLLLYSLPGEAHLLLLGRSRPSAPLMRLRSKQMLNVFDEKVVVFNQLETESLFKALGLPASYARAANSECFGRVSKLIEFADDVTATLPSS